MCRQETFDNKSTQDSVYRAAEIHFGKWKRGNKQHKRKKEVSEDANELLMTKTA